MRGHWIARVVCLSLGFLVLLRGVSAWAETFHVAPGGNDAWSGRLQRPNAEGTDGPLASLGGARDAVRRLKSQGPLGEAVRVVVADGTYALREPLVLGPEDSGTAETPVVYEAASGARPLLTGGKKITGWKSGPDGTWTAHVPEAAQGKASFEQLYVGGRRATRARSPNKI